MIVGFDFDPVWDQRSQLLGGLVVLLEITALSMVLATIGGLGLSRLRRSRLRWVQALGFVVVQVLRGIALYVLVLWLFNGLVVATGITLTAFQTGVIALSLLNAAYLAEVFRAGYDALPAGQREAALAIGLTPRAVGRDVLAPQVLRISWPAMGNVLVDIAKDSAIVSVIGVSELMREADRWAQYYFLPFEFYTAAGAVYFVVVMAITLGWRAIERRLDVTAFPGRGGRMWPHAPWRSLTRIGAHPR